MLPKGYLIFVLHHHLPFIKHPEYPEFLEERWLYEAITETYLPTLHYFEKLKTENVPFEITVSLTPTLCEMLADPLLQKRMLHYIDNLIKLGEKEVKRTRGDERFYYTALHYYNKFIKQRDLFINKYQKNLLNGYRELQQSKHLEIITCTGTHVYIPNFKNEPAGIRASIRIAKMNYEKHFGQPPKGIWLAENGYYEHCDRYLINEGIRYFFLEHHGILFGDPRPVYGTFAPVYTPSGMAAFARDLDSAKQVWSSTEGYPGDFNYREFYRDIGFELPLEEIKEFLPDGELRVQTGYKYYRITGKTDNKEPYNREAAVNKAAEHAGHFLFNRVCQIEFLATQMNRPPLISSLYDAELYGHWWYEGPEFLYYLIKKIHYDQQAVKLITPINYLRKYPVNQIITPNTSSWGYKGYSEVWLNNINEWILYYIHEATERMEKIANKKKEASAEENRVLNQMARELLLAQSSDWPFIITTGTTIEYAEKRIKEHITNFNKLYESLRSNKINLEFLTECETKNSIFQEMDYKIFL